MAMLKGDTTALPDGWEVGAGNWATRPATAAEMAAKRNLTDIVDRTFAIRACIIDGKLCVRDAETARRFDERAQA